MPADVRINEVTADVSMADASAMLTPSVMDRIVQEVLRRLEEETQDEKAAEQERTLGAARGREGGF